MSQDDMLELKKRLSDDPFALKAWNGFITKVNSGMVEEFTEGYEAWEGDTEDFIRVHLKEFTELRNNLFYIKNHLVLLGISEPDWSAMTDSLTEIVSVLRVSLDD